jgi:hypothetical protein
VTSRGNDAADSNRGANQSLQVLPKTLRSEETLGLTDPFEPVTVAARTRPP